jgi:hypothetical protein
MDLYHHLMQALVLMEHIRWWFFMETAIYYVIAVFLLTNLRIDYYTRRKAMRKPSQLLECYLPEALNNTPSLESFIVATSQRLNVAFKKQVYTTKNSTATTELITSSEARYIALIDSDLRVQLFDCLLNTSVKSVVTNTQSENVARPVCTLSIH